MAYELINNGPATPHRIYALLRLMTNLKTASRAEVLDLLQPKTLGYDQKVPRDTIDAAIHLGFLHPMEGQRSDILKLRPDAGLIDTVEEFRSQVQKRVLGVTATSQPNSLFNMFTAWYATQDERVLKWSADDAAKHFNEQFSLDRTDRAFNSTKFAAWKTWSQFLGLCWPLKIPNLSELNIPSAHGRLKPLLSSLLPEPDRLVDFGAFLRDLAEACPELDGGSLFEQCWHSRQTSEERANRLSMMLSNALRHLYDAGAIELAHQADAVSRWSLYRATGHPVQHITHIKLRSN